MVGTDPTLPKASAVVWILAFSPTRERPIACSWPTSLGAGAVVVSARDGAVNHRMPIAGIGNQMFEDRFTHSRLGSSAMPAMHVFPVAEPLGQVAPGNVSPAAAKHRLNEESVISSSPDIVLTRPQQRRRTRPLISAQSAASHPYALKWLTAYEPKDMPQ